MNKNISGVVVRGIVLIIIVYLLSMKVEWVRNDSSSSIILLDCRVQKPAGS